MKVRKALQSLGAIAVMTIVTLAALEIILRVVDLRELREGVSERSLSYQYDSELGWMPIPGSRSTVTNARTIQAHHNSLGLRDEEFTLDAKPTIMFLGDSFVWGLDAEAGERFSELLKPRLPNTKILAAGVSGFGTDQEYLLLQKAVAEGEAGDRGADFLHRITTVRITAATSATRATKSRTSRSPRTVRWCCRDNPSPNHACKPSRKIGGCAIPGWSGSATRSI